MGMGNKRKIDRTESDSNDSNDSDSSGDVILTKFN